jgi:hypothetical protein
MIPRPPDSSRRRQHLGDCSEVVCHPKNRFATKPARAFPFLVIPEVARRRDVHDSPISNRSRPKLESPLSPLHENKGINRNISQRFEDHEDKSHENGKKATEAPKPIFGGSSVDITNRLDQTTSTISHALTSIKKCKVLFVSGSETFTGHTQFGGRQRCCARMRCTSCDFEVVRVLDMRWSKHTDYLQLRLLMPDVSKLASLLESLSGSCAYACQCNWLSTNTLKTINLGEIGHDSDKQIRWICAGH